MWIPQQRAWLATVGVSVCTQSSQALDYLLGDPALALATDNPDVSGGSVFYTGLLLGIDESSAQHCSKIRSGTWIVAIEDVKDKA